MSNIGISLDSTSRMVKVGNLDIHYHDSGSGDQVVVLLHGGGPGASSWSNFQRNIGPLSEHFRVLAIDMPHFGKSTKPEGRYLDRPWYAEVVGATLDTLNISKAHFVGNSLGGSVSMVLSVERPEIVDRLVLMGTMGSLPVFAPLPPEGAKHIIEYYHGEGPTREKLEAFLRSMIYDQNLITTDFIEERFIASTTPELLFVAQQPKLNTHFTQWQTADQVKHKSLLLYGRDDRVVPWDTSLLLLRLMPNADLHIFSRCGHWAQWERADEFNSVVANFLSGPET